MSLFKNKKQQPALYYVLDNKLQEIKEQGLRHFYYPLEEDEYDRAAAWALTNRAILEISHKTDNKIIYKFSGF